MQLGADANFFITDALSGCGVQIFARETAPIVSHANLKHHGNERNAIPDKQDDKIKIMDEGQFPKIVLSNLVEKEQSRPNMPNYHV